MTNNRQVGVTTCSSGSGRLLLHHPGLQASLPQLLHLLRPQDVAALELQVAQLLLDQRHLVLAQRRRGPRLLSGLCPRPLFFLPIGRRRLAPPLILTLDL